MKARFLMTLVLTVQILAPTAALSDDDSKWASGRDGFQDFCDSISKSLSGVAKSFTGDTGAASEEDAAYGSKRGAWDSFFQAPKPISREIVTVEGQKKVLESKNVVIKGTDGTRISHRTAHGSSNFTPLKKMIDGGGSSYNVGAMSAAGGSSYYAMGSGIGGGGGRGGWGSSAGSRAGGTTRYGFGGGAEGPKTSGAWGGTGLSGASAGGASRGFGYR